MQKIRVAAVSPRCVGGDDKQSNLASAWRGIQAAKAQGAELAVFSELYLIHCLDNRSYRAAEPVPEGPVAQEIIRFAGESGVAVAIGIEELDPNTGVVYNTHSLAGPQGYIGKHRKTHLMVSEWRAHRPGCELGVFDIGNVDAPGDLADTHADPAAGEAGLLHLLLDGGLNVRPLQQHVCAGLGVAGAVAGARGRTSPR